MSNYKKIKFGTGGKTYEAEVVNSLPKGYAFWLMTNVEEKGYALLVPKKKDHNVDVSKVKAIRVEQTKEWIEALGILSSFKTDDLIKNVENYIKRHGNTKNARIKYYIQVLQSVLPQLKKISGA